MDTQNLIDLDDSNRCEDYISIALKIFECCGADRDGLLHVNTLMEEFAPFIKTEKSEYIYLKSLLDPDMTNPLVGVKSLATALEEFNHKEDSKTEDSLNFKHSEHNTIDSGLETSGLQLLEELQTELREKSHLINKMSNQIEYSERQHEDSVALLTNERDLLKNHLHMLREENASLSYLKNDYEEMCELNQTNEQKLKSTTEEAEILRKRVKTLQDTVEKMEHEKETLQDLLNKSKEECHRMNDMYAQRQACLLTENESLKADFAEQISKLHDQDNYLQQLIKEKVVLEMEIKDMLNKSNIADKMENSIDVSYCDASVLRTLDSLHMASNYEPANVSPEEIFMCNDDSGRKTNVSLFEEFRNSNINFFDRPKSHCDLCRIRQETFMIDVSIQTDDKKCIDCESNTEYNNNIYGAQYCCNQCGEVNDLHEYMCRECRIGDTCNNCVQNSSNVKQLQYDLQKSADAVFMLQNQVACIEMKLCCGCMQYSKSIQLYCSECVIKKTVCSKCTEINSIIPLDVTNQRYSNGVKVECCIVCEQNTNVEKYCNNCIKELKTPCKNSIQCSLNDAVTQTELNSSNEEELLKCFKCLQKSVGVPLYCGNCFTETKSCLNCLQQSQNVAQLKSDLEQCYIVISKLQDELSDRKNKELKFYNGLKQARDQTVILRNRIKDFEHLSIHWAQQFDNMSQLKMELERSIENVLVMQGQLAGYEENLDVLQEVVDTIEAKNNIFQMIIDCLKSRLDCLDVNVGLRCDDVESIVGTFEKHDKVNVSTQIEKGCLKCSSIEEINSKNIVISYCRNAFGGLFHVLAIVCFAISLLILYNVMQYNFTTRRCIKSTAPMPWQWISMQDVVDYLFTIEYVGEVPM